MTSHECSKRNDDWIWHRAALGEVCRNRGGDCYRVAFVFGHENDITSEAADAVILDRSLGKVDELIHIGRRMRKIALQSALIGMALSAAGMVLAAFGWLPPISGAVQLRRN